MSNPFDAVLQGLLQPRKCAGGCGTEVFGPALCDECIARDAMRRRETIGQAALDSIPPRYRWARREAPELVTRVWGGGDTIRRVLDAALAGQSILLVGKSGSGKTSVACAALRAIVEAGREPNSSSPVRRRAHGCRFLDCYGVAKGRSQWPLGRGEAPEVEAALRASSLVLDELGSEQHSSAPLAEILHERDQAEQQTIVTTWLNSNEVRAKYGDGIARRLGRNGLVIQMGGA